MRNQLQTNLQKLLKLKSGKKRSLNPLLFRKQLKKKHDVKKKKQFENFIKITGCKPSLGLSDDSQMIANLVDMLEKNYDKEN